MKVLLFSNNHTVINMIALALEPSQEIKLDVAETMDNVRERKYDWMLVNDSFPMYQESLSLAKKLGDPRTVILHQPGNTMVDSFDHHVEKPFLPSEILELLTSDQSSDTTSKPKKKKKKKKKLKKIDTPSNILNLDEIETIKALLEEDGLEIVHEEELAQKVIEDGGSRDKTTKNANKKLLKALKTMKPKKIRKLLKGAKIDIQITFPEDT